MGKFQYKQNQTLLYLILISTLVYVGSFLLLKSSLFYENARYFIHYLYWFSQTFLDGNVNNLVVEGTFNFFAVDECSYLISSAMVYTLGFANAIFLILFYLQPILIFHLINQSFYSEFHSGLSDVLMMKSGRNKYISGTVFSSWAIGISLCMLPRLFFFILCLLFFPNGYTFINLEYSHLLDSMFSFSTFPIQPYLFILYDFLLLLVYSTLFSLLSLFIVSVSQSRVLSYGTFLLVVVLQSVLGIGSFFLTDDQSKIFTMTPWLYGFSLFHEASYVGFDHLFRGAAEYFIAILIAFFLLVWKLRKSANA